jgi:putative spermidine/putrescine transport system ATP-binding protein
MADLSLNGLSKHYGDFYAVREVSLSIADGEFLVLLGPSGCGKTTTLRMVAGFIEPSAGHVRLAGQDVTLLPPWKRNAGMVFQSYALFPHMTVAQNVAFGLEMRKLSRADIGRRVEETLALVRLGGYGGRLPRQLSGGQRQRVALARALAIRPDVLLLDEPLSNLDAKLRQEVRVEIRELQRQLGLTTVMVTHDQEEALTMADRLVVMNEGSVRQVGSQRDLYERSAAPPSSPAPWRRPAVSAATAVSPWPAPAAARAAPRCRSGRSGSRSACSRGPDSTTACPVLWNSCRISAP